MNNINVSNGQRFVAIATPFLMLNPQVARFASPVITLWESYQLLNNEAQPKYTPST